MHYIYVKGENEGLSVATNKMSFDVSSIMISYKIRVKFLVDMTYMKFQSRLRQRLNMRVHCCSTFIRGVVC